MSIAYWIVAGLTALAFLATGAMKLARPKDGLLGMGMAFAEDFAPWQLKLVGLVEVLGAIGVVLPMALRVAPLLSPIAGIGLAVVMLGAIATHVRRREQFIPPLVLLLLAAAVAVLGFLVLA